MANKMTQKQYQEIKNETYTLITFTQEGRRVCTYRGLTAYKLTKELLECHGKFITLVLNDNQVDIIGSSWNIEDYNEYFQMDRKLVF